MTASSTARLPCTGLYLDWKQKSLAVVEVHLAVVPQARELAVGFYIRIEQDI